MDINEYYEKYGRKSNKCELCGKHYKMPTFIFKPRDEICFTCEVTLIKRNVLQIVESVI